MPESVNTSTSLIKSRLSLDDKTYKSLKVHLLREMTVLNLLGKRLNTNANKSLLQQVFTNVCCTFEGQFKSTPPNLINKYLSTLAQRCNYNYKRRRLQEKDGWDTIVNDTKEVTETQSGSRPSSSSHTSNSDVERDRHERPIFRIMIQITTPKNGAVLYRPKDILTQQDPNLKPLLRKEIQSMCLEDLDFDKFVAILHKDLDYDADTMTIKSDDVNLRKFSIFNESQWRAVLQQMYYMGANCFSFVLEEKRARE